MIYTPRKRRYGWGDLIGSTTSSGQVNPSQNSEQQLDSTLSTGLSMYNPILGALAKLGTGVADKIRGNGQDQSKDYVSSFINPFTEGHGFVNGHLEETIPGLGRLFAAQRIKQDAMRMQRVQTNTADTQIEKNSQGILANYPTYGLPQGKYGMKILNFGRITHPNFFRGIHSHKTQKIGHYYANGGQYFLSRFDSGGRKDHQNATPLFYYGGRKNWQHNPSEYPTNWALGGNLPQITDDSDGTRLASNVALYNGATHEGGGIDLDTNQDGHKDIEVENNEVIKDDMVLSDRLYPTENVRHGMRKLGISFKEGDTYANIAERLGKKKGDWEKKLDSGLRGEATAAKLMIQKFDSAIDDLFQDQQSQKEEQGIGKYPDGGPITPVSWKSQGVMSPDTVMRGTMYQMPYNIQNQLYKTPIPSGVNPTDPSYITVGPGQTDPNTLMQQLQRRGVAFHTITGNQVNHSNMGGFRVGGYYSRGGNITIPFHEKSYLDRNMMDHMLEKPHDDYSLEQSMYKHGGIYIKPSHRGRFNAYKKSHHVTTEQALHSKNPHVRQMANFARNAAKWHHAFGGYYTPERAMGGYSATDDQYASPFFYDDQKVKGFNPNGGNRTLYALGDFIENNFGNIASAVGTGINQSYIDKVGTNITPSLAPTPTFTYNDRSDYLRNLNQAQFRTLSSGLGRSSGADNLGLRSNMYAQTLGATNEALDREQQRKDAYTQHYQQMLQYNNMFNSQVLNNTNQYNQQMRNQKLGLSQANYNNFIQSILGNKAQKDAANLDVLKTGLYSSMSGDRGVAERMNEIFRSNPAWAKYFPELKKRNKQTGDESSTGIPAWDANSTPGMPKTFKRGGRISRRIGSY